MATRIMLLLVLFCSVSFAEVDTTVEQEKIIEQGRTYLRAFQQWYARSLPQEPIRVATRKQKPILSLSQLPTSRDLYRASPTKLARIASQLAGCRIVDNGRIVRLRWVEESDGRCVILEKIDIGNRYVQIHLDIDAPDRTKSGDWVFFRGHISKYQEGRLYVEPTYIRFVQPPYKAPRNWMPRGATPHDRVPKVVKQEPRPLTVLERFQERRRKGYDELHSVGGDDNAPTQVERARSTRSKHRKPIPE